MEFLLGMVFGVALLALGAVYADKIEAWYSRRK